ncbi:uncharacterized protein B0T15DRAFT_534319 [Chaetomium strumarium]|uniref:2EXR domain-containing protein n=1 Tax=Chaetomium strumarium TaxID=1170767 RepID=A0AAJ0GTY4_9PEZI|nr:hypothetical protein B0T15DRAFT_534319 [Chaetomium strumarium]
MSDTSEESDSFGYVAEAPDDEGPHESDNSDESGSESDYGGLLDMEADESNGEDSESEESDAYQEAYYFPQFTRLPIELRYRIWELFCPDLTAKGRVYSFPIDSPRNYRSNAPLDLGVMAREMLKQQTEPARVTLAVHRESRQLALKAFPDTLSFDRESCDEKGLVRFDSKRDIVHVDNVDELVDDDEQHLYFNKPFSGFGEHIRNLAINMNTMCALGNSKYSALLTRFFPNVETVFYVTIPHDHEPEHLRWCFSPVANSYYFKFWEDGPIGLRPVEQAYYWPDIENHRDLVDAQVPMGDMAKDLDTEGLDMAIMSLEEEGARIYPLVDILCHTEKPGIERWRSYIETGHRTWGYTFNPQHPSVDEYYSDEDEDEYESSGIDDSDLGEDEPGYDSDDLVVLDDDDSNQDDENSEEDSHSQSDAEAQLTRDDLESVAQFSSPEESSATLRQSDDPQDESDQPVTRPSRMKRPRGRVVASDSEDDSDDAGGPSRKRARTRSRDNPTVLSSDDEEEEAEDEVRKRRVVRAARVISLDSDSEDNEDEVEENDSGTSQSEDGQPDGSRSISSSEDEDEDEDEKSEGGVSLSRPLSLAEKLQLHRQKVPIPPSDDGDSEVEETGGDLYDAREYGDFQDDEEDNEISEHGDEYDQDRLTVDGDEDDDDY